MSGEKNLAVPCIWASTAFDLRLPTRLQVYDILKPVLLEKEKAEKRLKVR